jgi:hypothetical protein
MKLDIYIIAAESILTAYFINLSHQSVCLYEFHTIVARQRLGKRVAAATNTRNSVRVCGSVCLSPFTETVV